MIYNTIRLTDDTILDEKENIDIISKQFGNSANDYLLSKDHSTGNDLEKLANF